MLRIVGGGLVKKTTLKHVKKSEALVLTQKKVRGMISNAILGDEADTHVDMPSGVRELIDPIKQKINELHQRKSNGEENVIKDLMQGLPEQSLNHALEVMEKKSGVQQHERISQLADVLVEEIGLLDTSISYLNKTKVELIQNFSDTLLEEYATGSKGGLMQLSNEKIVNDLKDCKTFQAALRRITATSSSTSEAPPPTRNCTVM